MILPSKLQELGLTLPPPPKPVGAYVPAIVVGKQVIVSGQLPIMDGKLMFFGDVPNKVSVFQAQAAARQCLLNGIAAAAEAVEGVHNLLRLVQIQGFVQSPRGFADQAQVINGASDMALALMGEAGKHARFAVGVASLPLDSPVEIGFIFERK